jgi:hypothetical protein
MVSYGFWCAGLFLDPQKQSNDPVPLGFIRLGRRSYPGIIARMLFYHMYPLFSFAILDLESRSPLPFSRNPCVVNGLPLFGAPKRPIWAILGPSRGILQVILASGGLNGFFENLLRISGQIRFREFPSPGHRLD